MIETNYDFKVLEKDVFIQKGDYTKIEGRKAIVRGDNGAVLAIVSDKYKLVSHAEVVGSFRSALKGSRIQETIRVTKGGARLYMDMTLPDVKVKVKSGDEIALKLTAINSYDGSCGLQVIFGAFRVVCSNGLIFGEKFLELDQRHVGGVGMRVELLTTQIEVLTDKFRKTVPVIERMIATTLDTNTKHLRGELFSEEEVKLPEYLLAAAHDEYAKEGDGSVWGWYNAFTKVITHSMRRESPAAQIAYGKIVWKKALELANA